MEALNCLTMSGQSWEFADCIFAHQEFKGCKMGSVESKIGDEWDEAYPLVISGHIHEAQNLADNIIYIGSSIQQSYAESPNKRVWLIDWESDGTNEDEDSSFQVTKLGLGMKQKKLLHMTVDEVNKKVDTHDEKFLERVKKFNVKIKVSGTSAELLAFRSSTNYNTLVSKGVLFAYTRIKKRVENENKPLEILTVDREQPSEGKEIIEEIEGKENIEEVSVAAILKTAPHKKPASDFLASHGELILAQILLNGGEMWACRT